MDKHQWGGLGGGFHRQQNNVMGDARGGGGGGGGAHMWGTSHTADPSGMMVKQPLPGRRAANDASILPTTTAAMVNVNHGGSEQALEETMGRFGGLSLGRAAGAQQLDKRVCGGDVNGRVTSSGGLSLDQHQVGSSFCTRVREGTIDIVLRSTTYYTNSTVVWVCVQYCSRSAVP